MEGIFPRNAGYLLLAAIAMLIIKLIAKETYLAKTWYFKLYNDFKVNTSLTEYRFKNVTSESKVQ